MSYNILNKNVNFQGSTQGTIEDIVDTHSTQTINGLKTVTHLTGTHVRVTNDAIVLGNVSASVNISASAFYSNGVLVNPSGGGISFDGATANGLLTFKDADEASVESNLTFDGSVLDFKATSISGSGNISGSAFYGDGSNLSNVAAVSVTLASNGGLANSSGLLVDPNNATETTSADGSDFLLVADANDSNNLKKITCQRVANLFDPVVSTFNGQTQHRVVTVGGAETIEGQTNLTFNGSVLSVTGDVSGSGQLQIGGDITGSAISVQTIALANASSLAGAGLINNSGVLDIEVTGAIKLASDKVGISGSIAGNGLSFVGGADSVSSMAVNLESNSGLAVASSGLKLSMNSLATATPAATSDSVAFIDSDGDKKCSFSTFLTAIAGSGLGVNNSQLTASSQVTDIDALSALGGTGLHQTQDHFMFSDNGTEKKITFSNLEDAIFANVSGDATIAAGGTLTIAANAVQDSMVNDDVATGLAGDGLAASSGVLSVGVDDTGIEINSDALRLKDNGVTLAKMAGLARGKFIIGDASGDPSALTLGSAGQLLVSDGDDLLYRSLGGDATLGADGTLTIAANAVEGSMLNSNVAGAGLDYGSNQLSVDVSDFLANGSGNRIVTAVNADSMNAEANMTFTGDFLNVVGSGSIDRLGINKDPASDERFIVSGSNTEYLMQFKQAGNGYPTAFLAGESHSSYAGVFYNRDTFVNAGAISQGNLVGGAGSHVRLTVRKTSITDNTATSIVTITVPNANHAAAIRVFGLANFDNCNYAQSFSFEGSLARGSGSPVDKAFSSVTVKENAGITPNFTIAAAGSANTGANDATQTFDLQLTIDTSDGSSSNATIMIELINFNDSGITMAAS
mgnify:CR=1 FL=1